MVIISKTDPMIEERRLINIRGYQGGTKKEKSTCYLIVLSSTKVKFRNQSSTVGRWVWGGSQTVTELHYTHLSTLCIHCNISCVSVCIR